jgi:hypothetical protein
MTSWQVQFTGQLDLSIDASVYEIDLFDTSSAAVEKLHQAGRHAVCYIDAGTWEGWRPDASRYPASVLGNSNHWPDERWVDIRRLSILAPILTARMDLCKAKGFDAVAFDNVNGYTINTGFPLTYDDQLRFNAYLANAAHARHLSVAIINDVGQLSRLVSYFDWAIVEQCFQYKECGQTQPFLDAHEAVMAVEYGLPLSQFCSRANAMRISAIEKRIDLDAYRVACS